VERCVRSSHDQSITKVLWCILIARCYSVGYLYYLAGHPVMKLRESRTARHRYPSLSFLLNTGNSRHKNNSLNMYPAYIHVDVNNRHVIQKQSA
jgi:hypothetical protein